MSIKNNKPTAKSGFRQGYYKLNNPDKYIGDPTKIIYRSSWEYRFCKYCDDGENVVKWSSEPVGIKYTSPIDSKQHDYYIDFYARIKKGDTEEDYLTMKRLKNYNYALQTWITNRAKFQAAKDHAERIGYKFVIVTEKFLFDR